MAVDNKTDNLDSLYVPRPQLEAVVKLWLEDPRPQFRLYSLVGPAGMGKLWFLRYFVHQQYASRENYLVIWLDLREKLAQGTPLFQYLTDRDQWLKETVDAAAHRFSSFIVPYDRTVAWAAMWETFTRNLCRLPGVQTILLVNGLDEVQEERTRWFIEDQLITPFVSSTCTRTMLTRQDELGLNHPYLRMNEYIITMEPLAVQERENLMDILLAHLTGNPEQIAALAEAVSFGELPATPDENRLTEVKESLLPYLSGNLFINSYLLCHWLSKGVKPGEEVVKRGVEKLARRAGVTAEAAKLLANWQPVRSSSQVPKERIDLNDTRVTELLRAGLAYLPPRRSEAISHPSLLMGNQPTIDR